MKQAQRYCPDCKSKVLAQKITKDKSALRGGALFVLFILSCLFPPFLILFFIFAAVAFFGSIAEMFGNVSKSYLCTKCGSATSRLFDGSTSGTGSALKAIGMVVLVIAAGLYVIGSIDGESQDQEAPVVKEVVRETTTTSKETAEAISRIKIKEFPKVEVKEAPIDLIPNAEKICKRSKDAVEAFLNSFDKKSLSARKRAEKAAVKEIELVERKTISELLYNKFSITATLYNVEEITFRDEMGLVALSGDLDDTGVRATFKYRDIEIIAILSRKYPSWSKRLYNKLYNMDTESNQCVKIQARGLVPMVYGYMYNESDRAIMRASYFGCANTPNKQCINSLVNLPDVKSFMCDPTSKTYATRLISVSKCK
jgi:hypothetical protein